MHNSLFLGDNILENKLIKIQEYDSGRFLSVNLLNNVFFSEHGKILARILPSFAPRLASLGAANVPRKNVIQEVHILKTFFPGKIAFLPRTSSMRNSWLYLATRSVRESDPVLICPTPLPTAKSAMVVSSVSPER